LGINGVVDILYSSFAVNQDKERRVRLGASVVRALLVKEVLYPAMPSKECCRLLREDVSSMDQDTEQSGFTACGSMERIVLLAPPCNLMILHC
jgi:hypothetical protein